MYRKFSVEKIDELSADRNIRTYDRVKKCTLGLDIHIAYTYNVTLLKYIVLIYWFFFTRRPEILGANHMLEGKYYPLKGQIIPSYLKKRIHTLDSIKWKKVWMKSKWIPLYNSFLLKCQQKHRREKDHYVIFIGTNDM